MVSRSFQEERVSYLNTGVGQFKRDTLGQVGRDRVGQFCKTRWVSLRATEQIDLVENEGIKDARRQPGFQGEPLKGRLLGKRSIRLSKQWRVIYTASKN